MVKATRPCPRSPTSSSLPHLHAGSSCSSAWGWSRWSFRPTSTKRRTPGRSPSITPAGSPAANATPSPAARHPGRGRWPCSAPTPPSSSTTPFWASRVDESDARAMLGRLAGRRHEVVTAYRIRHLARTVERAVTTAVFVRRYTRRSSTLTSRRASGAARPAVTRSRGSPPPSSPSCAGPSPTWSACRWPRCWRICRRSAPCPPTRGRGFEASVTRAEEIAAGLAEVRDPHRRRRAGSRARIGSRFSLIAVSKKMPAEDVARRAGGRPARLRRELRAGAARQARRDAPAIRSPPRWHFIGPLQSNKVKYVAGLVALVHTVDSLALLEAIEAARRPATLSRASERGWRVRQARDRAGGSARSAGSVRDRPARALPGSHVDPTPRRSAEDSRPHFAALRALRDGEARAGGRTSIWSTSRWG